ncbi:SDR family oxidoreductase [Micromonospora sp. NPDC050795]|uniref:SDR family oxidoreductase n=1 Tax=Micromonospora sp. NPDC050795 TaxID=3364282 RepID=UPI0037B4D64C
MRTWFITGTSSGIGWHLTEQLIARGERVAATARNLEVLTDLLAVASGRLWTAELDVTDFAAVRATVGRAFADLGRIDMVVSNAGYGQFGAAEELSDELITRQLDTNLIGSIQLARTVIPHLREQGGGRIIQISSAGGQTAVPGMSLYHASKWGIEGFLEAVAGEVATFDIEITLVEPGFAATGFYSPSSIQLAPALEVYRQTSLGELRDVFASGAAAAYAPGDPAKMAAAIIDSADASPAPRRLVLGSDAYESIERALQERLAALRSQEQAARSTDIDRPEATATPR